MVKATVHTASMLVVDALKSLNLFDSNIITYLTRGSNEFDNG